MTGSYRNEREEARARLKASVDALAERTSLQVQMQKEPLKMLGGASAVGALLGVVAGRQLRRSKKIYVDATSPEKHQKALIKAQKKHQGGGGVGGALVATLGTLAFKVLRDRVLQPKLEEMANTMLERSGQPASSGGQGQGGQTRPAQSQPTQARPTPSRSILARPAQPQTTQAQTTRTQAARPQAAQDRGAGDASVPDWVGTPVRGGKAHMQPVIPARPPGGDDPSQEARTGGAASFLKRDNNEPVDATQAGGPPEPAGVTGGQTLGVTARDLPKPEEPVEAKAQGSPIAPQEKVNPNIS
ncbi:hypothetical protein [Deinococcus planocerae]|uniref:hypothetical protein n=1 Tax=Deinococcus planocerae TaxID=1737569 RepID=UPI001FEA5E74|nr:hypothetical protein [Deinococcus planocerae]